MEKEIKIEVILKGEPLYLVEMIKSQTGMSYTELFSKMLELYKLVYLSEYELALVQGDVIIQKFNTEDLKRKIFND